MCGWRYTLEISSSFFTSPSRDGLERFVAARCGRMIAGVWVVATIRLMPMYIKSRNFSMPPGTTKDEYILFFTSGCINIYIYSGIVRDKKMLNVL